MGTRMERLHQQRRHGVRKSKAYGMVSVLLGITFLASSGVLKVSAESATNQVMEKVSVGYRYLTLEELSLQEREELVQTLPKSVVKEATYYVVYQPKVETAHQLPKTNSVQSSLAILLGMGALILAIKVGKNGKKTILYMATLTGFAGLTMATTSYAISGGILSAYNQDMFLQVGSELPSGRVEIDGYEFVGYLTTKKQQELTLSTEQSAVTELKKVDKLTDTSVTQTPITEAPAAETSVEPVPVVETPVTEPVVEVPVTEPVVETPVTEPVVEAPVTETPIVEAPVTEPVIETPVTEPVVEAPVTETVVETPVTEPVVETPVTEPVVEAPVTEPVVETPVTEPVVEAPVTEPVVEAPVTETVVETPVTETVVETPVTEPVVETPVTEPVVEVPVTEPVVETPVTEPPVTEPVVETPVTEPAVEAPTTENVFFAEALNKAFLEFRQSQGLRELTYNTALQDFADRRARQITEEYSHSYQGQSVSNMLREELTSQGFKLTFFGSRENIGGTYFAEMPEDAAKQIVEAWSNSQGHRKNMVNALNQYAVSMIKIGDFAYYGVLVSYTAR